MAIRLIVNHRISRHVSEEIVSEFETTILSDPGVTPFGENSLLIDRNYDQVVARHTWSDRWGKMIELISGLEP